MFGQGLLDRISLFHSLFPPSPCPRRETEVRKKRLLCKPLFSSTSHIAMCFLPVPWGKKNPFPARKTPKSTPKSRRVNDSQGCKTCQRVNLNPKASARRQSRCPLTCWDKSQKINDWQQQKYSVAGLKPCTRPCWRQSRRGRAGNRPSPALRLWVCPEKKQKKKLPPKNRGRADKALGFLSS